MNAYLLNAFSLQMVDVPCSVHFEEVDVLPEGLISAIGHQDTANVTFEFVNGSHSIVNIFKF